MIFIKFWWTLMVFCSHGFALENTDVEKKPSDKSDSIDFPEMTVQKSKLETAKDTWTWLKEVDDWCRDDTNSGSTQKRSENQLKEAVCEEKDGQATDQDNTSMKCSALLNDPEDDYELYKMELSDRFHKVLSGRVPEELTNIVFELVHNDTNFEQMVSVLESNLKARYGKLIFQSEEEGDYCEIMTRQKCLRDRNPFVPRLQKFYDMILKTADEEQKILEKRQLSLWILAENYTTKIGQHQDLLLGDQLAEPKVHDEL